MNFVTDTHALVWWCTGSPKLSITLIERKQNREGLFKKKQIKRFSQFQYLIYIHRIDEL